MLNKQTKIFYNIILGLFILFIIVPIIYTFATALFFDTLLSNNIQLFNAKTFILLAKSIGIATIVGLFSTFFGIILGFVLYKTNVKFRALLKLLLLIPLVISPYILAVAWKDFFFTLFNSTSLSSSYLGVILVLTIIFTPLSMLIIGSAFANINSKIEESSLMITNLQNTILKIILPLIKPAIITSFVLVFIFSISEFSVPVFFGVNVFTTEIFTQFSAFYNHSLAILQSVLLIIICVLLLFAERKYIADAPFLSIGSKGISNKYYSEKNLNAFSLIFLFVWIIISTISSFLIIVFQAFKDGGSTLIKAFNLLLPTFVNSIFIAFAGAIITVIIGFVAAHYSSQTKKRNSFIWILLIVFAIPSTILGISFIKFYNQPFLNFIYGTYAIIIIGYIAKFSFIATKLISNAIKQVPKSLDEAAQISGITSFARLQKILIPIILPSVFVAFLVSFIFSFGELGTTIMLYPPGTEIMPIKVFTIMANAPQSLTSSMTLIVFSLTLILISLFYFAAKPFIKNYNND